MFDYQKHLSHMIEPKEALYRYYKDVMMKMCRVKHWGQKVVDQHLDLSSRTETVSAQMPCLHEISFWFLAFDYSLEVQIV